MTISGLPKVGILGAGRMATGLATLLAEAGYDVVVSRRDPKQSADYPVPVTSIGEAANHGDVVVLAVPHSAVEALATTVDDVLDGKILIDITNSVVYQDGRIRSGLDRESNGSWVAAKFPGSRVTRAYNHIQDEMLVSRARRQPGNWAVAVAGDNEEAVRVTKEIVVATHYVPVFVGTLAESLVIDPGGPVFPHMMTPADLGDLLAAAKARPSVTT